MFSDLCRTYEIQGYPTFHYFSQGSAVSKYEGGRKRDDFAQFLRNPPKAEEKLEEEKPKEEVKKEEPKEEKKKEEAPKAKVEL